MKYQIPYTHKSQEEFPHIIKFSGGRSSGMMLFILLENNLLDKGRGDCVVFNNTSSEHQKTYEFIEQCMERCDIPFFWTEWCLYPEKAEVGVSPKPTYRITEPADAKKKGEIFEAVVSHNTLLPNYFQRLCTNHMKIKTTKRFMIDHHHGTADRKGVEGSIDPAHQFDLYRKRGGRAFEFEEFCKFKKYSWDSVSIRESYNLGRSRTVGWYEDHISFIGIRGNEQRRQMSIMSRAKEEDELIFMPLCDLGLNEKDVWDFWNEMDFDFDCPKGIRLSNCTFCFLKGPSYLKQLHEYLGEESDIEWWQNMERKYSRFSNPDKGETELGFFGTSTNVYENIISGKSPPQLDLFDLPCNCTD